jgi:hypothetical protein
MRLSKFYRPTLLVVLLLLMSAAVAKNDKQAAPSGTRVHHQYLTVPARDAAPGTKDVEPAKQTAPNQVVVPRLFAVPSEKPPPSARFPAFSKAETAVVRDYFLAHPAKGTPLPPVLVAAYGRDKVLPLGVEKKELPWGLMKRLPLRLDQEYCQVGRDVVILERETQFVIDIMKDVFG